MLPVETPFKTYTGLDGKPLDQGFVYFGQPNQNPITDPVTVYWDAAGTMPASQPLRTTNGYIVRSGTPANVFFDGAYSELVQTKAGVQVFYARTSDEFSIATQVSNLAKQAGASLIGFIQAGVGAVKRTVQDELRDTIKITQFGGAVGVTNAANKAALQKAIAAADAAGGGYVVVPGGINYGYVRTNPSTHPDFAGCSTSITVIDYGVGDSYADPAQDGAQIRQFFSTPNPGNADANVIYHRAGWHPAHLISNDAKLAAPGAPSRTDLDNRRVSLFFENDGSSTWRVGQGNRIGKTLTDEELSNFVIESYTMPGDTLGNWAPLIIERKTGNFAFGQGNTTPQAGYYFKPMTPGFPVMVLEGLDVAPSFVMRNSNGSGDDIQLQNRSGDFVFSIPALGDAVFIKKATRYMGIGAAGNFMLDVADSRSGSFVSKINNTNATNGRVLYLASSSAPGTGWDALLAEASGGNAIFRLRGDGNGFCDGAWAGGGADRAEMFEWADGNPDGWGGDKKSAGSNRAGYVVALINGKIKICEPGETPIGVVSLTYDSLGNAAPLNWASKFLSDEFGCPVMEACETVEWEDRILRESTQDANHYDVKKHSYYADEVPDGVIVPADAKRTAAQRRKVNQAFDNSATYIPRTARKEWDAIGILGICRIRKGQITAPSWLRLRNVSDQVEEWLVR
jgi:hypothetical protein